jgi:hypothetical protein
MLAGGAWARREIALRFMIRGLSLLFVGNIGRAVCPFEEVGCIIIIVQVVLFATDILSCSPVLHKQPLCLACFPRPS